MKKPVRFALIGASSVAIHHGRVLQRCPMAVLSKIYSRDRERAKVLGKLLRVDWTTNYEDILTDPQIDALDIVTEPERHVVLARSGLNHGKHLLIEKPIGVDLHEAEEFMKLAERSSLCVSVVAPRRFDPILKQMKRDLDAGAIGRPTEVSVSILLRRDLSYYQHGSGWRGIYGNVLLNQAIHWIDVLIWMLGSPGQVSAKLVKRRRDLPVYDEATVWAAHPSGVNSTLHASTAHDHSMPEWFQVKGTQGILDSRIVRRSVGARIYCWSSAIRDGVVAACRGRQPYQRDLLDTQVADVIYSIRTGSPPAVSIRDGYEALRVVRMCEAESQVPLEGAPA